MGTRKRVFAASIPFSGSSRAYLEQKRTLNTQECQIAGECGNSLPSEYWQAAAPGPRRRYWVTSGNRVVTCINSPTVTGTSGGAGQPGAASRAAEGSPAKKALRGSVSCTRRRLGRGSLAATTFTRERRSPSQAVREERMLTPGGQAERSGCPEETHW